MAGDRYLITDQNATYFLTFTVLLDKFSYHARRTGRAKDYKLWRDDNHAIYLDNATTTSQKIDYIHQNPVTALIVANAEDYLHSSANVYAGSKQALVKVWFFDEDAVTPGRDVVSSET